MMRIVKKVQAKRWAMLQPMRTSNLPRLVDLRKELGLSRAQLGAALGVTERSIGRYENGQSDPVLGDLKKMAAFFGVSVSYLIGESEQKQQRQ